MKKAKKIIALVLVLALSISLLSTLAFADEPFEAKKHTVLFFGDQSIDFKNLTYEYKIDAEQSEETTGSYADAFVEYLRTGPAKDSTVKGVKANILDEDTINELKEYFPELANFSGMRNSDLYALIRPLKEDPMLKIFDIDNPAPTQDAYFFKLMGENYEVGEKVFNYDTTDEDARQALLEALLGVTEQSVFNGIEEPVALLADPDVKTIVLDLTRNDLTGYFVERLMDIVEKDGETYEQDTLASLPYNISNEVHPILAVAMEALQLALNDVFFADKDLASQISAAAEYTMLNFCLGFTEAVAALKYWYPNAKLVAVGASNELNGVKITIPNKHYKEGNGSSKTISIDVGAIYKSISSFANSYITDFAGKYGLNNTYYYAAPKNVGTIFQSEADQDDFKDAIARDAAGRVGAMAGAAISNLLNGINSDFDEELQKIGIDIATELTADVVKVTNLGDNVVKAAQKENSFYLVEILNIVNDPEKTADQKTAEVMALVAGALTHGMLYEYENLTDTDKAILGLYGIIADMSYGTLPGAKGQEAKYDAVVEGYNKLLPANRDGEDTVGGFFLDGLFSVLNVFKSDILNSLNNFFNNLFDNSLFTKIGDFFRGILGRT